MKYKSNSLFLLISSPDSRAWSFLEQVTFGPCDHLLLLSESDFEQPNQTIEHGFKIERTILPNCEDLISEPEVIYRTVKRPSHFQRLLAMIAFEPLTELKIIGNRSSSQLLTNILGQVRDSFGASTSLTIVHFDVDSQLFNLILEISDDIEFDNCWLTDGWWLKGPTTRLCERLSFRNCSGSIPNELEFGQAAFDKLTSIWIAENVEARHLYPSPSLKFGFGPSLIVSSNAFTANLVKAFWSSNLIWLRLSFCRSAEWIENLPALESLSGLDFDHTPVSNRVFSWICKNRGITHLTLAWEKGVRHEWRSLANLKNLKSLDVSATHFDDEDLEELADSVKLRSLEAYYTSITPACWRFVLPWPSLRSFWAASEAMEGALPDNLPAATQLREVVALNAILEPFQELLARYPKVKLVQM